MSTLKGKFDQVKDYLQPQSQQEQDPGFKKYLRDRYSMDTLPREKHYHEPFRQTKESGSSALNC
jgi:hypothetical protein